MRLERGAEAAGQLTVFACFSALSATSVGPSSSPKSLLHRVSPAEPAKISSSGREAEAERWGVRGVK